jgi:hypothetical protein
MARLYGVDTPLDSERVKQNLRAIFESNFREDLSEHANPQRPGYALGEEAGLVLCSWPRGRRLTFPFPYAEEVWTGIEYLVASHLIMEGLVDEGMKVVQAVRERHDGRVRNPFNEYECGNYYARAMSSYALLQALSGYRYLAPARRLEFAPQVQRESFHCFFSTATGWGTISHRASTCTLAVEEGFLEIESFAFDGREVAWKARVEAGQSASIAVN